MKIEEISKLSLNDLKTYKDETRKLFEKYERLTPTGNMGFDSNDKEYQSQFNKWRNVYTAFENEIIKRIENFI